MEIWLPVGKREGLSGEESVSRKRIKGRKEWSEHGAGLFRRQRQLDLAGEVKKREQRRDICVGGLSSPLSISSSL